MFKRFRSLFRVLTRRRNFEDGMSEELRFHIEAYAEDLMRSGLPRSEAMRRSAPATPPRGAPRRACGSNGRAATRQVSPWGVVDHPSIRAK